MKAAFLCVLALAAALATPALSLADETPNPALVACKAEYVQIGADAFATRYGASEPYQACLKAHGVTTTPPTVTLPAPTVSSPEAACKAEYVKLGADAFAAKYGANEPLQACLKAHGVTPPAKPTPPPAISGPEAACKAEYLKLGADAFAAKYGAKEPFAACVKAQGSGGDRGATTPATTLAAKLCELDYKQLGADGFAAKYGSGDAGKRACLQAKAAQAAAILSRCKSADDSENCVKQALGQAQPKPADKRPKAVPPAALLAKARCIAQARSLGKAAFQARYGDGKNGFAACFKAALPKARWLVAECKKASAGSKDSFKRCVVAAAKSAGVG